MKKHPAEAAKPARPTRPSGPRRPTDTSVAATERVPDTEAAAGLPGEMAARLLPVRFGIFKPDAREVCVAGSFNGWDPRAHPLQRDSLGDWSIELALPPGEHRYRLIVDGVWCDDPSAQRMVANPFGGFDAIIQV